jgi:hypothetical protein
MHRVFVDSNVLGSRTLYDWLFLLHQATTMFSLQVTPDVLDEAHRVWRRKHPSAGGQMRAKREKLFQANFDEVLDDWQGGNVPGIKDADDQHVHNAATHCRADILLTSNVKDFGDPDLLSYDLMTPDEFFILINKSASFPVREVTQFQNDYWQGRRDRGDTVQSLAEALKAAGCNKFSRVVEQHLRVLAGPLTV